MSSVVCSLSMELGYLKQFLLYDICEVIDIVAVFSQTPGYFNFTVRLGTF